MKHEPVGSLALQDSSLLFCLKETVLSCIFNKINIESWNQVHLFLKRSEKGGFVTPSWQGLGKWINFDKENPIMIFRSKINMHKLFMLLTIFLIKAWKLNEFCMIFFSKIL